MKAIQTKFIGQTDHKPARIRAWVQTCETDRREVIISWPMDVDGEAAHRKAAVVLCEKMNWPTDFISGALLKGYVFVFTDKADFNRAG